MFETVAYENLKKQEVLTRSPDLKSGPKLFGLDGLRDVEPKKLLGKRCRNNQNLKLFKAIFFPFADPKTCVIL